VRKGVILVTHDLAEAMALGDRVGVMDDGHLIWCGRPEAIVTASDVRVRQLIDSVTPLGSPAGA
jgi:ABC-type proline/glycine betaine transport system ATPase subunit